MKTPYGLVPNAVWEWKLGKGQDATIVSILSMPAANGHVLVKYTLAGTNKTYAGNVESFVHHYGLKFLDDPTYPGSEWVDEQGSFYTYTILESYPAENRLVYSYKSGKSNSSGTSFYAIDKWLKNLKPLDETNIVSTTGVLL